MSDDLLDYLREQFTRLHKRLVAIERGIAAVRRDAVLESEAAIDRQAAYDALAERVNRIEQRLELGS